MVNFISFREGENYLLDNGLPSTCYFLLSTKAVADFTSLDTLASIGEITGTGYERQSQPRPTSNDGQGTFILMSWATGIASDWSASVKSVVLVTSLDNSGVAICAWNLRENGAPRSLNQPNLVENLTPTLSTGS